MVFAAILQDLSHCHEASRQRPALVTCCVVKGKMTGIHSPPEPVKQQGDSLLECNSTVWKQYSPRQWQTMSVCAVIPREETDFSAGDSECGAHRSCLSALLPACLHSAGKESGSIYSDLWNQSRSVLRITEALPGVFPNSWEGRFWKSLSAQQDSMQGEGWRWRRPMSPQPLLCPKQVGHRHTVWPLHSCKHWQGWRLNCTDKRTAPEKWKGVFTQ